MKGWSYETQASPCVHKIRVYDHRKGEVICSKCGLVVREQILEATTF